MYLLQTKQGSRRSGGPQYYFHGLSGPVQLYLRRQGAVQVALVTPYGATKSDFLALSKDRKIDRKTRKLVAARVDHDRIQQGSASESIGESIRKWYNLANSDFARIDVDIDVIEDTFYIAPVTYRFSNSARLHEIPRVERPLTFTRGNVSRLWRDQIASLNRELVTWSLAEICRVVNDHKNWVPHIQEQDILRAAGPLKHLGVGLGAYVGKGYDCLTDFTFLKYPTYRVPVEIKRHSKNFNYQEKKYGREELSRAVILCAFHDKKNVHRNIDVIELDALCEELRNL